MQVHTTAVLPVCNCLSHSSWPVRFGACPAPIVAARQYGSPDQPFVRGTARWQLTAVSEHDWMTVLAGQWVTRSKWDY